MTVDAEVNTRKASRRIDRVSGTAGQDLVLGMVGNSIACNPVVALEHRASDRNSRQRGRKERGR